MPKKPRYKLIFRPVDVDHDHVGSVQFNDVTPPGMEWPLTDTSAIRARLSPFSLEEVLCACNLESVEIIHAGSTDRVLGHGPLAGFRIDLPGLAYAARQALVVCQASSWPPESVSPEVQDAVRRAALDAHRHVAFAGRASAPLDIDQSTRFLLALAGWQSPFILGETLRRVRRYLTIFDAPLPSHRNLGPTLSHAFEDVFDMTFAEFVGIGWYLFMRVTALPPRFFCPTVWLDTFEPLWTDPAMARHYSKQKVETFLRLVSRPVEEHRALAAAPFANDAEAPDNPVAFNTLRKFPLVALESGHYVVPIPQFLPLRFTDGAYWDLVDHHRKGRENQVPAAMGDAVEDYVGQLLRAKFGDRQVHTWGSLTFKGGPQGDTHGPDFAVVRNRSVLLLEVKKVTPTLPINERGDIAAFTGLLDRDVLSPLRKLPGKERQLLADARTRAVLPRNPDTIHAVVTLGEFLMQPMWWPRYAFPLLIGQQPVNAPSVFYPTRHALYPPDHPHHLISMRELEEATTAEAPHLISLLRRTWRRGAGHELARTLLELPGGERHNPVLDATAARWAALHDIERAAAADGNIKIFGCLRPDESNPSSSGTAVDP